MWSKNVVPFNTIKTIGTESIKFGFVEVYMGAEQIAEKKQKVWWIMIQFRLLGD